MILIAFIFAMMLSAVEVGFRRTASRIGAGGQNTANSFGQTVTSGAANAKGSYAQIVASTSFDCRGFVFFFEANSVSARDWLVDIAVGGSGSEQVIVANMLWTSLTSYPYIPIFFPIPIPAGSRIAVRGQCTASTVTGSVSVTLLAGGDGQPSTGGRSETCGATTGTTKGTSVDPGGTANTPGAYSQLIASTGFAYSWLLIMVGNQAQTTRTNGTGWLVDIAIGAAASEQVVVPQIPFNVAATNTGVAGCLLIPVDIPAGVRVSARAQCGINTATVRLLDVEVIGFA